MGLQSWEVGPCSLGQVGCPFELHQMCCTLMENPALLSLALGASLEAFFKNYKTNKTKSWLNVLFLKRNKLQRFIPSKPAQGQRQELAEPGCPQGGTLLLWAWLGSSLCPSLISGSSCTPQSSVALLSCSPPSTDGDM